MNDICFTSKHGPAAALVNGAVFGRGLSVLVKCTNKYDTQSIAARGDSKFIATTRTKNKFTRQGLGRVYQCPTENHNRGKNWVSKWIKYVFRGSVLYTTNYGFLFRSRYIIPFVWPFLRSARCSNGFPRKCGLETEQPSTAVTDL